jgi:uncharacterized protein (TIGR02265 family)
MMEEPDRGSVKGSVLASRLAFVREEMGDDAVSHVLERLTEEDRTHLATLHPQEWSPFATNVRLDHAIAQEMQRGDAIFRTLGVASAEHNLASPGQRHFLRDKDPHALLKHTSAIFGLYYDTGYRLYEKVSPTKAVLRTHACRSFSVEDCLTVVGWHERALEMCGAKDAHVTETRCRARGDECCEYVCEWR